MNSITALKFWVFFYCKLEFDLLAAFLLAVLALLWQLQLNLNQPRLKAYIIRTTDVCLMSGET